MSTWKKKLIRGKQRLEARLERPARTAILGVGQELSGDDAAGLEVARRMLIQKAGGILVIEAGLAPENFTGALRRFGPDLVLLVDAAQMEASPGEICCLDPRETSGISACTHTFPLGLLAEYLSGSLGCEVALVGIQPAGNEFGAGLSEPVKAAVESVSLELLKTFGNS
jgi:hydrogenase maturation protease HycI